MKWVLVCDERLIVHERSTRRGSNPISGTGPHYRFPDRELGIPAAGSRFRPTTGTGPIKT